MAENKNRNQRLWELFQERATLSQRDFGEKYEIGSVSNVSQYLHGFRPLNLRAALKFARGLQVSLNEISPELAVLVSDAAKALDTAPAAFPTTGKPVSVYSPNIAVYAAKGANATCLCTCYTGYENVRNLIAVEVESDDMQPTLTRGDRLIMDTQLSPEPGDIVLATIDGRENAVLREYAVAGVDKQGKDIFELVALDRRFPNFNSAHIGIKVLATMIEHRRYRRK